MHIRKSISGTKDMPRMYVFKSNKNFYVGLADDENNVVLLSKKCDKNEKDIKSLSKKMAKDLVGYEKIVFDRSGYRFHGLIKTFVEVLRENKVNI